MDLTCFALHHKTEYRADFNFFFRNAYNRNSLVDLINVIISFCANHTQQLTSVDNYQAFSQRKHIHQVFLLIFYR
jgi:hypothetical protein